MFSMQYRASAHLSVARRPLAAQALMAAAPRRSAAPRRGQPVVTWAAASQGPDSDGQRMKRREQPSKSGSNSSKSRSLSGEEAAELAVSLEPLAALAGMGAAAAMSLTSAVAGLRPKTRQLVLEHGYAVAQLLLVEGVTGRQLAGLLTTCPDLFTWPAAGRGRLPPSFEQLAQMLGMTAADVARCIIEYPAAARAGSDVISAAIGALTRGSRQPGEFIMNRHQLAALVRDTPSAVELLCQPAADLAQRLADISERYSSYWDDRDTGDDERPRRLNAPDEILAGALACNWHLLITDWSYFLVVEALLQDEIGQEPGDGTRLVAYCILHRADLLNPNESAGKLNTLQDRARALVAEFGHEALCWGPTTAVPSLLAVAPAVWQAALAVWDIIGVPDPESLALHNSHLVTVSWLNPDRLSIVETLRRMLPGQLSTAEVIDACAAYSMFGTQRIIGRLLFLEQQGLLDRFVRIKAGEPDSRQLISLADVANHKDRSFAALVARLRARPSQQVQAEFEQFNATLVELPEYQACLARGEALARAVARQLPPGLLEEASQARRSGKAVRRIAGGPRRRNCL